MSAQPGQPPPAVRRPEAERPIYHYHVRKTAGSSLNSAFCALGGLEGVDSRELGKGGGAVGRGLRFVGPRKPLIEAGDYFFGTSHFPAWWLNLPPQTFTVTILRDPVSRVVSYYRYLLWARDNPTRSDLEPSIDTVVAESAFLDGGARHAAAQLSLNSLRHERSAIRSLGLRRFAARLDPRRREPGFRSLLAGIPPRHLLTQLHMFSESFDPAEAAENVLACSAVCFTETFGADLAALARTLDLDLREQHERRFGGEVEIADVELELLRERLAPEYEMLDRVRAGLD